MPKEMVQIIKSMMKINHCGTILILLNTVFSIITDIYTP